MALPCSSPQPCFSFPMSLGLGVVPYLAQHPAHRLGYLPGRRRRFSMAVPPPVGRIARLPEKQLAGPSGGRVGLHWPVRPLGFRDLRLPGHRPHRKADGLHAAQRGSPDPVLPRRRPLALRPLHQLLLFRPHNHSLPHQPQRGRLLHSLQPGRSHHPRPGRGCRLRAGL